MTSPKVGPIRVLIADDELPARQRLLDLLHKDAAVGTISQAENGAIAVEMIRASKPDYFFWMCRCRSWMGSVWSMRLARRRCR